MRKSIDNVKRIEKPAKGGKALGSGDQVLELLHTITHQYRALQFRHLRDGPYAVTHMDSKVLAFFGRRPGATRERGLLRAEPDPADRRNTQLWLSEAGAVVQAGLREGLQAVGRRAVKGLDGEQAAQLMVLLGHISANLEDDTE